MSLAIQPIPILQDNYAWLLRAGDGTVAVVDPGEAGPVEEVLRRDHGGRLDLILLTHHHGDHIDGVPALREAFPGARVVGAAADRERLGPLDLEVREGDAVAVGEARARVLETPGHTRGHICLHFEEDRALFAGDTLFSLGCGRLLEGTPEEMWASLNKLAALPGDTLVHCGHEYTQTNARFAVEVEPRNLVLRERADQVDAMRAAGRPTVPSLLHEEKAANPFLRAGSLEEFRLRRERRDRFR